MKRLASLMLAGALLAGCASAQGHKQEVGAVLGAVAGAAVAADMTRGHGDGQLAAVAAGTLLGTLVGSEIGKSLDRQDRMYLARTQQRALETAPSGSATRWRNPDTGHYGTVTPAPAYQNQAGRYCREFTQEIIIGGERHEGYGTACRQPDGSWKII